MSDLVLTAADQRNVQSAIRTLLVCAQHPNLDAWRLACHREMKRLIDGDMVMSYIGVQPFDAVISEESPRVSEFPRRAAPMVSKFNVFARSERLVVWSRSTLWHGRMHEFLRSSFYQDFARPLHSIDGVGISIKSSGIHASIQIHRDSKLGGPLMDHELGLLKLVLPAFQVGTDIASSYFAAPSPPSVALVQSLGEKATGPTVWIGSNLTQRELEVAKLLAARRSNYEIAETLRVSRATAKRHTENILLKLGLQSRLEVERVLEGH
jgi:DNA-binding CsgD family transcriptional regulator